MRRVRRSACREGINIWEAALASCAAPHLAPCCTGCATTSAKVAKSHQAPAQFWSQGQQQFFPTQHDNGPIVSQFISMPSCIVRGCTYSWYKKDPNITLHSFPRDLDAIKAWLLQTKQDFGDLDEFSQRVLEGTRTGVYRICSQHFTADSYERCGLITYVKKGAVPTIFPAPTPGTKASQNKPVAPKKRKATTVSLPRATDADLGVLQPIIGEEGNYTSAIPFSSGIHLRTMSLSSRKKTASGLSKKTVGTSTEYFPGQVHKTTNTEPFWGTKNKEVQCCSRTAHRSVGLQCNLEDLPPLGGWWTESQATESTHNSSPDRGTPTKDEAIVPLFRLP